MSQPASLDIADIDDVKPSDTRTKRQILESHCPQCISASNCSRRGCGTKNPANATDIDKALPDVLGQLPPLPSPLPAAHPDFAATMPPDQPVHRKFSVFLAGSIEMGKAIQWQQHMIKFLQHLPISVYNPRRGKWDNSVTAQATDVRFAFQVEWELAAMENADVICFFFDSITLSPVSMLELGLWMKSKKVVVCCPAEYWKGGNIHRTCSRYGVEWVKTFDDLVPKVVEMLEDKGMRLDANGDLVGDNSKDPAKIVECPDYHTYVTERLEKREAAST